MFPGNWGTTGSGLSVSSIGRLHWAWHVNTVMFPGLLVTQSTSYCQFSSDHRTGKNNFLQNKTWLITFVKQVKVNIRNVRSLADRHNVQSRVLHHLSAHPEVRRDPEGSLDSSHQDDRSHASTFASNDRMFAKKPCAIPKWIITEETEDQKMSQNTQK